MRLPLLFSIAFCISASVTQASGWSYKKGHHGPEEWAGSCQTGHEQSPVNIDTSKVVKGGLQALEFDYKPSAFSVWNNGHTIQFPWEAGSRLKIGDDVYWLLQFHFHTPSEEQIDGKPADMVAHLVHKNDAGQLAVVALLFKVGEENEPLAELFEHLPGMGARFEVGGTLDLNDVLPSNYAYYTLPGSLTTPPCTEGVRWIILKRQVTISKKQLAMFRKAYPMNARPVQPLRERVVQSSN
ncbi:carbonic anhydrase family protein [Burkholderiaceae bacterium DAT-1]|nr:carbonic anhydrase family protein [Burkholderiaceae bacterium DAT-1]